MSKPQKLSNGRWTIRVFIGTGPDGKKIRKSFTADTKKECERLAMEYQMSAEEEVSEDYQFQEAVSRYIDMQASVLSASTITAYRSILEIRIKPSKIGSMNISDLKTADFQLFISGLVGQLSPKTIRNIWGLCSATLSMFRPEFQPKVTLPRKGPSDQYTPSDDDIRALLEVCKRDRELYIAVCLAAFGTLRRGEACALEYEDIHGCNITVNKALAAKNCREFVLQLPKTDSSIRTVTMPKSIIDYIGTGTGRIIKCTPTAISSRFFRAVRSSGLPHFRYHDLRHYAASIMHAIGIPDQYIMSRGGWHSDNVMKSVYRNIISIEEKKQTEKLINYLENATL